MQKSNNKSYNRIVEYLDNIREIDDSEKRYLLYYAAQLYKNKVENVEHESLNDIYEALKIYSESLNGSVDNSITVKRILDVIEILQKISVSDVNDDVLMEISYIIDKLYCVSNLPIRKNSSLSYNLEKRIERKR